MVLGSVYRVPRLQETQAPEVVGEALVVKPVEGEKEWASAARLVACTQAVEVEVALDS